MEDFIRFISLSDPNVRYVVIGTVLLMASASLVGTFTFLTRRSLVGDAIAHAVLPGICMGFLISGSKNYFTLIGGAFFTGWLATYVLGYVTRKSKLKDDTATALVLSVFFGAGIMLLTMIQKSGNATQSGLDHFLFGKAAAITSNDLIAFGSVAVILAVTVFAFFKEFTVLVFDRQFAIATGMPVKALDFIMTSLTVMAVVIGIQAVGVVLMAAILITPAAAARYWTDNIRRMIVIAALFGAISGVSGAYISTLAPNMPTGPWIVVTVTVIALGSFFLSPRRGILGRYLRQLRISRTINDENILKALYQLGEKNGDYTKAFTRGEVLDKRAFQSGVITAGLNRLERQGYLTSYRDEILLTREGTNRGRRIVKLHRLWELYLTTKLNLAPDHVHDDAETIEHLLTPELEAELEHVLEYPTVDPHNATIPYKKNHE